MVIETRSGRTKPVSRGSASTAGTQGGEEGPVLDHVAERSRIITVLPILFLPFFFELPAVAYLLFWFLSQLLSGTLSGLSSRDVGGVAVWAHVGGFAAGVLLHRLFLLPRRTGRRRFERDEYGIEGAWAPWRP